jgi:hypothetical protein
MELVYVLVLEAKFCEFESRPGHQFLQTKKRVGVSPGRLCAVMYICRIRCMGESPIVVAGVELIYLRLAYKYQP